MLDQGFAQLIMVSIKQVELKFHGFSCIRITNLNPDLGKVLQENKLHMHMHIDMIDS